MIAVTQIPKRRNRWQDKRLRLLKKMAAMRAAKECKRLARGPREEEPRLVRTTGLEWAMRDKITGETVWLEFRSVRDLARRATVVRRFYVPGIRSGLRNDVSYENSELVPTPSPTHPATHPHPRGTPE